MDLWWSGLDDNILKFCLLKNEVNKTKKKNHAQKTNVYLKHTYTGAAVHTDLNASFPGPVGLTPHESKKRYNFLRSYWQEEPNPYMLSITFSDPDLIHSPKSVRVSWSCYIVFFHVEPWKKVCFIISGCYAHADSKVLLNHFQRIGSPYFYSQKLLCLHRNLQVWV